MAQYQRDLFPQLLDLDRFNATQRIHLLPLRRKNQQTPWSPDIRRLLGRVRHHIETVFSTLTTVFNVERPGGRSLAGHVVRIATCVLVQTLSFWMP